MAFTNKTNSIRSLSVHAKKLSHSLRRAGYTVRSDLGFSQLYPDWKKFFRSKDLKQDTIAGLTVACIALPLSLAIALASGVKPEVGLISAIVGGIVAAFFGGTPLAVTGPAAAMAVLISTSVQMHGLSGLLVIGLGCGLLQLFTGIFRLGRFIQFVPTPVVVGFTAGIGAIIFIGQLPVALGLPAPEQSKVINVIVHLFDFLHQTQWHSTLLSLSSLAIIFILPKIFPKIPAPLVAVAFGSILAAVLKFPVQTIGNIPNSLPLPHLPVFEKSSFLSLVGTCISVYAIASLETLLSSSAVDKLYKGKKHDPDQELIGQGISNTVVSLFGGIPVTGVIARSALNIQAGARTRRSAIVHSFALIACVYFFSSFIGQIPIPVLAGVLLSVSLRMLNLKDFLELWHLSKADTLIYGITFVAIVLVDLIAGIQAGLVAALLIAAISLGRTKARTHFFTGMDSSRISIEGSLSFMSASKIELIRNQLVKTDLKSGLIVDLSKITVVDSSGGQLFVDVINDLLDLDVKVALRYSNKKIKKTLCSLDPTRRLEHLFTDSELDAISLVETEGSGEYARNSMDRLKAGVERFRQDHRPGYQPLFDKLAKGQKPHTMLITCSDSRINPNLITSTEPGELFIVRNVGNIIPPFGTDQMPAEGAAIEFAIGVLEVENIVICGHSECGAMKAFVDGDIFKPENSKKFPSVSQWLSGLNSIKEKLPHKVSANEASEINVLAQVQNLKSYPLIQEKLKQNKIKIHAWYYDITRADLEEWSESNHKYVPVQLGSS